MSGGDARRPEEALSPVGDSGHDVLQIHPDAVEDLLRGGESETVEFKAGVPSQDALARIFIAFGNADGGILLIGVGANGEPQGLSVLEQQEALARCAAVGLSLFGQTIPTAVVNVRGYDLVYVGVPRAPPQLLPVTDARGHGYQRRGAQIVRTPETQTTPAPGQAAGKELRIFVAMSFAHESLPALVDYYGAMKRAAESTGLPIALERVDEAPGHYEISQAIMDRIDRCDAVLADFTLSPHNVYYEAGYAKAKGKGIIHTAQQGTDLKFDVRNWRATFYRNATELEAKLKPEFVELYRRLRPPPR